MDNDRIPGEFRYWDNLHKPRAKAWRRGLRLLFRADPVLPDATVRTFAHAYYDADPVAEAFVDEVYLGQDRASGRAMLDQALESGLHSVSNPPDSLVRLFEEFERRPDWLDEATLALGARVFRRWSTHLFSFAGAITLEGYRENSVTKPLAFTGAYNGESANRRFLETAQFWLDVAEPGGLDPGGQGMKTAMRVRIMHVFVRARLSRHPEWDREAWGVPISQGDAMLTLMGGSFLPGTMLKLMGYRTTRREIEATLHFWRYVGHLLGVQPKWYPETVEQALGLMYTAALKGTRGAGDDATQLAHSYLDAYGPRPEHKTQESWVRRWEYNLQKGYVGFFLPYWTHRHYKLPRPGIWWFHPLLQAPVIFARETLIHRSSTVDNWWDQRARAKAEKWVRARLGKRAAEYKAVESFTR